MANKIIFPFVGFRNSFRLNLITSFLFFKSHEYCFNSCAVSSR